MSLSRVPALLSDSEGAGSELCSRPTSVADSVSGTVSFRLAINLVALRVFGYTPEYSSVNWG